MQAPFGIVLGDVQRWLDTVPDDACVEASLNFVAAPTRVLMLLAEDSGHRVATVGARNLANAGLCLVLGDLRHLLFDNATDLILDGVVEQLELASFRTRHEGHYRNKGERSVQVSLAQADPRQGTAEEHIWHPRLVFHTLDAEVPPPEEERDENACSHQQQPNGFGGMIGVRIKDGDDDETERVIRDRQKQQVVDRRVSGAEHQTRGDPRQGYVCGRDDAPTA
mmetsp:Transcript_35006/g.96831  ORF Transcript_35006/g.96831 Transcript_35006/m.96831 type:complete len:223 (-) Transcript_35006:315-983(-)